jgi:hypothetical protein
MRHRGSGAGCHALELERRIDVHQHAIFVAVDDMKHISGCTQELATAAIASEAE